MAETKHTPGLTREHVFSIADKYGAFEFGDAQGDKRLAFAADVVAAHERIRAAAPVLLDLAQDTLALIEDLTDSIRYIDRVQDLEARLRAAISRATGEAA